jgi:hypothetical protein
MNWGLFTYQSIMVLHFRSIAHLDRGEGENSLASNKYELIRFPVYEIEYNTLHIYYYKMKSNL